MPKYKNNPAYAIKGIDVIVLHINRYDEQLTKCLTLNQDLLTEIVNNYRNGEQLLILISNRDCILIDCIDITSDLTSPRISTLPL